MQINHLHDDDGFVTASPRRAALIGAAVEFLTRTSLGFWRG
jgi:hypothetical protein